MLPVRASTRTREAGATVVVRIVPRLAVIIEQALLRRFVEEAIVVASEVAMAMHRETVTSYRPRIPHYHHPQQQDLRKPGTVFRNCYHRSMVDEPLAHFTYGMHRPHYCIVGVIIYKEIIYTKDWGVKR